MKKRIFKSVFVIALLLCITLVLFACSSVDIEMTDQNPEEGSGDSAITITYVDGNEVIHSTTDLENALSYLPEDKEGYSFVGWYLDSELSQPVGEMLTQSISLYAKWNVKTFSVRFINHDGSIIPVNGLPVQTVEYGNSAIAPEDPVYEGHEFIGWSIDFSSVKSDLAIRANFGTAKQSIILYGEDGALLSSEKVEVGSDITFKYNTLLEDASQSLPGGLALDTLCIDEELSIPYQVPSGEHLMPTTDLVLYVRPTIVDIEGLKITPSRSTFRYDLQGFNLQGSLSENLIIDYSFEWVDVTNGWEIENNTQSAIEIGCKDVGEYVYELRATASYKNLEPKVSTVRTTIVVNPGTLEGLISVDGFEGVYNGLERDLIFTGLLEGDVVTYRRVGEENYANNPIKNAGDYNVETMVVRKNYEPLELPSVTVKLEKAELKLEVSLSETEDFVDGKYILTYGSKIPKINYNIVGFVNGETENVLQGGKIENNPYYVGAEVNEYELGIQEDCWTSNNYKFIEWQTVILKVKKRALIVNAENKSVTYGDLKPQYTANLEGALELDVDNILGALKFTCSYKQRDDVGNYDIVVEYANDSYDVTLNKATLKVNPKSITLSPIDAKVTYGDPIPTYKFKAEGLLSGHSVDTLGNVQAICNYAYKSNAGSYTISVNTASVTNKNYRANYNTAKLTVSAKPVTLSLGSTEITYYDAYPNSEHFKALLSAEGLVEGDTIEKDLETINAHFTSAYAIGQPVGEYAIIINGYSSINYNINFHSGVMKVNKANMTIGVKSAEIVYGNFFAPELVYTGLFGDEKDEPELAFQTIGSISGYVEGCGVGSYILSASGYEASNYNVSYANGELNIIKREVTVVVDKKEITYGDAEPTYTYNLKSYMEGKEVFAEGESLATLGTLSIVAEGYVGNAGGYDVIASGLSNENYTVIYQNSTLSVKVKDVTVSPVSINLVYGDAVPTYTFVVDGLVAGDELGDLGTPIAICAYEYKSNVGSYPITLQAGVLQNSNYNVSLGQATLSVARKTATLTLTNKNITYYDAYPNNNEFASLLVAEGLVDGDSINQTLLTANASFTSDYRVGSNVGEYEVVVSGYESINYDLTVTNGYLIVGKKALTITMNNAEVLYGNEFEPIIIYNGLVGEEANYPPKAFERIGEIEGYEVGDCVGNYTVIYANAEAINYEISYISSQLKVVERPLVIRARDYTDDEEYWTASFGEEEKLILGGEGLYSEDNISGSIKTISFVSGAYVASGSQLGERFTWIDTLSISNGKDNTTSNYAITFDIQVAIKTYGIMVSVDEAVYDGKYYGINVEQIFEVPMAEIWYSLDNVTFQKDPIEFTQAGSYTLYYQYRVYAEANDFIATYGEEQVFEKIVNADEPAIININKRTITVVVDKKEITYGDAEPIYTYNLKSYMEGKEVFAEGESLATLGTLSIVAEGYVGNAGGYDVIASGLSNENYTVIYQNSTLSVKVKDVTVSPVAINLVYGDAVPTYTFVVDGLVAGDELGDLGTPIAICAYEYKSNVGSYPITLQSGVLQNSNYNVSLGQATLSVARKTATLTLANKNIIYYDAYPNNNEFASLLVAEGLVDGDSINQTLLTANASFTSDYRVGSNVGEYEVVVSGYESINYDLTVTNGYLIVGKKALTIGVEGDSLVYGETYEVIFTYDGLVGEEKNNPSLAISNLVLSGYTAGQGADTYTLSGAGAESTNYEISYTEGTLVISPRAVTLTINPQTITYGDDDPEFTYYFTAYKDGESVFAYDEDASALGTLKIVADGYVGNADKYDLIATGIGSTQNYALTVNTSTYVVNRKALTVSAKSYTITFGDAKPVFESDVDGLVKGETIASLGTQILYNCLFVEDRTAIAGVYDVEPLLSLGNYKISTTKGTLTVNKKAMTLSAKNFNVTFGDNTPELVAVPSVLAYNDTVDTIGSYELTTSYVRGNGVGSYAINLTASSQKYELSIVNGTIKVGQKSVEVSWSGNDATYVYNDTDRSSLIGATYVDIYGETIEAIVSFKASNSTPNRFHNAGNYTTTASTSDGNYKLTSATITLKMDKATYDESTIVYDGGTFSGVYSPDKTLGADYLFENNEDGVYRWKVEGTVPVVKTTTYIACYNADRENYYDVEISVSVTLSPATVTLSSEIFAVDEIYEIESEIDVNSTNLNPSYTISPTIWWWEDGVAKRAIGASGNYTIVYSNNNVFTPGSYYTVMAFMSDNYILNTEDGEQFVGYFLKYKSVDVGGTLYTPEDALYVASSGNVIVKSNTSFAMQAEVISYYYNDVAYYTVKSGVTLLLPYNATDTTGFIEEGEDGSANYTAHPEGDGGAALYLTLTVPSIVNLNVSGTLTVGAVTGKRGTGTKQNDVTGNYAEINLNGNVTASNAVINVYGYIKGAGQVTATGSTQITENMYLEGWVGGTISSVRFMGTTSLRSTQLMSSGTLSVSNPNMFPFSQYQLRAIQSKLELQYGSSLRGVIKIGTSKQSAFGMDVVKAKVSKAYFNIISSSTVADSGIIRMTTATDKVTKTYANERVKITTDGQIIDGYTSLSVLVLAKTVAMTTEKVLFAINGTIDVVVNSGSFTQTYKYKLMPGATITVKSGATYNMNGTIVTYKEGFSDISQYPYPAGRGDAKVIVEGTMNVNGSLGGSVYGVNGGKVVIGSNATITSVKSIEGTGSMATGSGFVGKLTMYFTFTESGSVVRNLDLFNASGSTTSASKGTTYTYNGTAWA